MFYYATNENLQTEQGKAYLEAFNNHWGAYVQNREKELKKNGSVVVLNIVSTAVLADVPYMVNEVTFFAGLCHELRRVMR